MRQIARGSGRKLQKKNVTPRTVRQLFQLGGKVPASGTSLREERAQFSNTNCAAKMRVALEE